LSVLKEEAMKIGGFALMGALAAFAAGCAHELVYMPVGPAASGGPAAQYPIPPGNPQGAAYVTSFGFTDLATGAPGGPLLHARLAVSNGGATVWTVDARLQQLVAPGQPPRPPSFVNTDAGGGGPTYQIPPGRANVFDLYFSVPPPQDQIGALGGFSLAWNVDAGGQLVAQATGFQRLEELATDDSYDDYPPYVALGLGFGVGWWGAPWFPYGGFSPYVRGYYYPPRGVQAGPWNGPHPPGWRAAPPVGGWAHASARAGWHAAAPDGFHSAPRGGFHGGSHGGVHGGGHR
jgi:hypothetical protein